MSDRRTPLHIVLVDDDPVICKAVEHCLTSPDLVLTSFCTYAEADAYFDALHRDSLAFPSRGTLASPARIDAVILDYYLEEGKTGLTLCRKLRDRGDLPIIMLTAETAVATTVQCLDAGADQFICKPFHAADLLARVKASIRARTTASSKDKRTYDRAGLSIHEREFEFGGTRVTLTEKESLLAQALLDKIGNNVSKEELYWQVSGRSMGMDSRSLDMLVTRLRQKFATASNQLCILSVRKFGYKLVVKQSGSNKQHNLQSGIPAQNHGH